jgi:hypothetical protein
MDMFEKYKETIYFTRSSMGKIHVQTTDYFRINDYKYLLKEDPEWEAKRISYWGEKVGAVFIRKIITNENILQMKIDSFKIVKGFPEFCWKYCMLTPKEYEDVKNFNCRKYESRANFREIIIPAISLDEYG